MSSIFLHVGQCGNQIGLPLWENIDKDQAVRVCHSFITWDDKLRSVHVDSEPKVIYKLRKCLKIREKNIVIDKRGRGTNWALGYNGYQLNNGDSLVDRSLECLRKEIERCDCYNGCVLLHSLSGGTGSGLGSRLCEVLRDEYPMNYLLACSVVPYASGESPLQHYNSLLSLCHLQRYTDGIIVIPNDEVLQKRQKQSAAEKISFQDINQIIASQLCGIFLPTDSLTPKSGFSIGSEPWEMLRSICPMPSTKFINIQHESRSQVSWESLISSAIQALRRHGSDGKPFSSLANLIVARGDSKNTFPAAFQKMDNKIKQAYGFVTWNPFPNDVWTAKTLSTSAKGSASLTIASNYSSVTDYLNHVCVKARAMLNVKAYLHWYYRYGATDDDFEQAIEILETTVESYKNATV